MTNGIIDDPERVIRADGPWTHRDIAAHGARFHVVEAGEGPAVIFLHGFPTFWWTWREQITALAAAGYRAIAMDMRGYGGSDHPPHGYDPRTLAADVAGVIRSLGETDAVIVGHGWGGLVAWSMPVLEPEVTRAIVPVGSPHPRRLRKAAFTDPAQLARMRYLVGLQWPLLPERSFTRHDGARIETLLREWSLDDSWVDGVAMTYRSAFLRWPTAHTAIEYHRWAVRSLARPDGLGYAEAMRTPIDVDVLHVQGEADPMIMRRTCEGSDAFVTGAYECRLLPGGHFVHEESSAAFNDTLIDWLKQRA